MSQLINKIPFGCFFNWKDNFVVN